MGDVVMEIIVMASLEEWNKIDPEEVKKFVEKKINEMLDEMVESGNINVETSCITLRFYRKSP